MANLPLLLRAQNVGSGSLGLGFVHLSLDPRGQQWRRGSCREGTLSGYSQGGVYGIPILCSISVSNQTRMENVVSPHPFSR